MCLGIPGRVVDLGTDGSDLAGVDVEGVVRPVNLGLLPDGDVRVGDWVMIHMGFALERMTEEEALEGLAVLQTLGPGAEDAIVGAEEEPPW